MTYGENKKIALALIEEYSPNLKEKTEDDENKVIYKYTMRVNEKS